MILRVFVFYAFTWFFLLLFGGLQQATGILPAEIGLAQWGPGVAALAMLAIFRKDAHRLVLRAKETPARRYLTAALLPLGLGLLVYILQAGLNIAKPAQEMSFQSLPLAVLWMPLGALGEELGWRGYLHKMLQPRLRGLYSSLLVGLLWMPIHVHFFSQGPLYLLLLAVLIIAYSIVLFTWMQASGFEVLLASIFHLSINLTNLLFLDVIYSTTFMLVNALVWATAAAVFVLARRDLYLSAPSRQ
jgi:membrane protease YdiL (CAAX protease family)